MTEPRREHGVAEEVRDPTPDVPRGVVNWPRQRQALEQWAKENGTWSDYRGYLSGAISTALQYLDMIAADNADFQKADAIYQRHREALEKIRALDYEEASGWSASFDQAQDIAERALNG